jgi:hypothetical protein
VIPLFLFFHLIFRGLQFFVHLRDFLVFCRDFCFVHELPVLLLLRGPKDVPYRTHL